MRELAPYVGEDPILPMAGIDHVDEHRLIYAVHLNLKHTAVGTGSVLIHATAETEHVLVHGPVAKPVQEAGVPARILSGRGEG